MANHVACAAALLVGRASAQASQWSLLRPVDTAQPNPREHPAFPPADGPARQFPPGKISVEGPKMTNKFWTHWTEDGAPQESTPVYPMPYGLKWETQDEGAYASSLMVSNAEPQYTYGDNNNVPADRIFMVDAPFRAEIGFGTSGCSLTTHEVFYEDLFGIHMKAICDGNHDQTITFPVFSGMAYVSAKYEGGLTPQLVRPSDAPFSNVTKVRNGVWQIVSEFGNEWRVYAMRANARMLVDNSYDIDMQGAMNQPLDGWVRVARVVNAGDTLMLDESARCIIAGGDLEVQSGHVRYDFRCAEGMEAAFLHFGWAHHVPLMSYRQHSDISQIGSPTKGNMTGFIGRTWDMRLNTSRAVNLGWLPSGDLLREHRPIVQEALDADWKEVSLSDHAELLSQDYRTTGQSLQRLAMMCLLLEEFYGQAHDDTQACAEVIVHSLRCLHSRRADDPEERACGSGPMSLVYDTTWKGVASRWGFFEGEMCDRRDFGNACYRNHHSHFGYLVVAASVAAKLRPTVMIENAFTEFVDMLIRDAVNPSKEDTHFPMFRGFDWFDFHSWSNGLGPAPNGLTGKDRESVSEDINMLYGMTLWGEVTERPWLTQLGETMLAASFLSIENYFFLRTGNAHMPEGLVKNHVVGMFSQQTIKQENHVSRELKVVHGSQMRPLTPALAAVRDQDFVEQEWINVLSQLGEDVTNNPEDGWTSVLITGSYALYEPAQAWERALKLRRLDRGLSRSYMYYWVAKLVNPVEPFVSAPWTGNDWAIYGAFAAVGNGIFFGFLYMAFFDLPERDRSEDLRAGKLDGEA